MNKQAKPGQLSIGDTVYVQGYEFTVVAVQPPAMAPNGRMTYYFTGQANNIPRNAHILGTGYERANYGTQEVK